MAVFLPLVCWTQVEAAIIFDPVNENPSLCPFRGTQQSAPVEKINKGLISDWIQNQIANVIDKVAWEHSIGRYVYTLGHTCVAEDDPLWDFVWPSHIPPVKPANA